MSNLAGVARLLGQVLLTALTPYSAAAISASRWVSLTAVPPRAAGISRAMPPNTTAATSKKRLSGSTNGGSNDRIRKRSRPRAATATTASNETVKAIGTPSLQLVNGDELVAISCRLHDRLKDQVWKGTSKQPVTCSYNVLEYASETNHAFTREYGGGRAHGRAFVVGMNPGPWGMVQTGVPFGEVSFVRDWLGISGAVGRPQVEHAKRPVDGFSCKRSEVSGTRLWGFFERRFGTANAWGDKMFVHNYCPLTFMSSTGGNITPDKLSPTERKLIDDACGEALAEMMSALRPSVVVAVGNFAGSKCAEAVKVSGIGSGPGETAVDVVVVNHPSPASPTGSKWEKASCMDELVLKSSASKEIDRFLT